MDFLKDIALPASLEHYRLIVLVAAISSMIVLPYVGFVIGTVWLSFRYRRQASNSAALALSYKLAACGLQQRSVPVFLAAIPGAALVFSYAQLLQSTPSFSVSLAGFGYVFMCIGLYLVYSYKETFRIQEILSSYQSIAEKKTPSAIAADAEQFRIETKQQYERSGTYGLALLILGLIFFAASCALIAAPDEWTTIDSLFAVFFSLNVWFKIILMGAIAAGSTGFGISYFIFSQSGNAPDSLSVQITGKRLIAFSLIMLPIALLINLANVSPAAMSGTLYALAGIALVAFFLAAHFAYGFYVSQTPSAALIGFVLFLTAVGLYIGSEYAAIGTATRSQAVVISKQHEKEMEDLQSKLGVTTVTFTGEDIYNAKCSACHLFDAKKVGPPYLQTIPKYAGKKSELISFIMNPVKKNPDYPPMPNQGLRQAEADSIAAYIMQKVAQLQSSSTK
ncbi:MAG TPA: cytochrome c [Bacteroidota bacterium]|nr:cytochrome c [Bacteroidota bacterium]